MGGGAVGEANNRFREIFSKSPIGILFYDKYGNLLDANPSALKIAGVKKLEDLKCLNLFDNPYLAPKKEKLINEGIIKFQSPINFENIRKMGFYDSTHSGTGYLDYIVSVTDFGFLLQVQDITERRQIEVALKESENKYRTLFESLNEGIWTIDKNGYTTFVNPVMANMLGYTVKEMIGKHLFSFMDEKNVELAKKYMKRRESGLKEHHDFEFIKKDGKKIYTTLATSPLVDEHNNYIGAIAGVLNITQRKQTEEALRKSQGKFQTLFNSIDEGFCIIEVIFDIHNKPVDYRFLEINPAFEKQTGLINANGKRMRELVPAHEDRWFEIYGEIALTGTPMRFENPAKALNKFYDVYAFKIGGPESRKVAVLFNDITDRKQLEEALRESVASKSKILNELRQSRDHLQEKVEERTAEIEEAYTSLKENETRLKEVVTELERSNEELQSFAYITSHDLQEPLRTIASYAGLIERRYKGRLDSDADEFIEYMISASKRMKKMIQGLLDYSRVGTRGSEFVKTDMNTNLENAISNLKSSIDKSNAKITHDILPPVTADPNQMIRVFQNLISNALKFKKPGTPLKIHISAEPDMEKYEYVFSVSDNGIGMEEQYTDKIFEVFKRLHTIDEYEGTGIGLAVVKRIIDRHGGRVWVESELSEGSIFYFTIPFNANKI